MAHTARPVVWALNPRPGIAEGSNRSPGNAKEKALRAAQEALVAETLQEQGCLRYELNESLDDGRILIFTEQWASEPEWRAHMEARPCGVSRPAVLRGSSPK
jgi:hypothetical protein